MIFFKKIGLPKIAWSLRRIYCPVPKNALVLEVGSGGNPYPRANVLLDAYIETRERHWAPLVSDRPTVIGFVESLPFKDKSFDFVIAAHVLEHSSNPEKFITELQRVAKAGYIEVPDAFMERINPYYDHRLEITTRDDTLIIRKKIAWNHDPEVVELYEAFSKPVVTRFLIPKYPSKFHVRYFWKDKISYHIFNPDVRADWPAPVMNIPVQSTSYKNKINKIVLHFLRWVLSQNRRNTSIQLIDLLTCPTCNHDHLTQKNDTLVCSNCDTTYATKNGIPILYPKEKS